MLSKKLTFLKGKSGHRVEVWHHPQCENPYYVEVTAPEGRVVQDFATERRAREVFERVSETMAG